MFSYEYNCSSFTVAVTFTVALETETFTLASLVKIANVAPAIRLMQSAIPINALSTVLLLKMLFHCFYTPFIYLAT